MPDSSLVPNTPWIPLSQAIEIAINAGLVPGYAEHDGVDWLTGDTLVPLSKLFGQEAFADRLHMLGWPTEPHGDVPTGREQEIPLTYFARERSFYGSAGIGRLPFEPTEEDERRDFELQRSKTPGPDFDWIDVLVSGPDLARLISASQSGAEQEPARVTVHRKKPGPKPGALLDTVRHMQTWLIEARAKTGYKMPRSSLGMAKACFEAKRDSISLDVDTLRKIFAGSYGPAVKLAEQGQIVAFWES